MSTRIDDRQETLEELAIPLKRAFEDVEIALRGLITHLLKADITDCAVFKYPRVTKEAEHDEYKYIPVRKQTGETAIGDAIAAFGRFRGESSESTKSVFRLPGVLSVQTGEPEKLLSLIYTVNAAKDRFAEVAESIEPTDRFDAVHKAFPRLIYLQVTRHVNFYSGPLQSSNFTWGGSESITKVSKDAVLDEIARQLNEGVISYDEARRDTEIISALPSSTELRKRRPVKVRPLVNLNKGKDHPKRYARKEGHLPLIVINAGKFKIGELRDYDPDKKRRVRSDKKISDTPLITSVPVYVKV